MNQINFEDVSQLPGEKDNWHLLIEAFLAPMVVLQSIDLVCCFCSFIWSRFFKS